MICSCCPTVRAICAFTLLAVGIAAQMPTSVKLHPKTPLVIPDPVTTEPAIVDSFEVKLSVTGDGVPFDLVSEKPLPDYVVRGIMKWRFDPFSSHTDVVTALIPVHLRRRLTRQLESNLIFGFKAGSELEDIERRVSKLSAAGAATMLAKLPPNELPDLPRSTLIVYYAMNPTPENEAARVSLVLSLIQNFPQAEILGTSYAALTSANKDAILQADTLWAAALQAYPKDKKVLEHAVVGTFLPRHVSVYEMMRAAAIAPDPLRDAGIMGTSSGWHAMGVTAIDLRTGHAIATQGINDSVVQSILQQKSPAFVLPAVKVFTLLGAQLRSAGAEPAKYLPTCDELVAHARELFPDTSSNCRLNNLEDANGKLIHPELVKKTAPKYSKEALDRKLNGDVALSVVVGKEGRITEIQFLRGALPFYESAVQAVSQWTFRPGMRDGAPVDVPATIEVNFRLR